MSDSSPRPKQAPPAEAKFSATGEPLPVGDAPRHPRRIPAWAMSMLLHLVLILLLAQWVRTPRGGAGDEPDRQVGVAIAHRMPDRTEYQAAEASAENAAEADETADAAQDAAASPPSAVAPLDIDGLLAEATEIPTPDASVGSGTSIEATGRAGQGLEYNGGGSPATTMVFGVSGTGRRFVYVFDRSESMNGFGGRPLAAAKREIIRSLRSLGPDHEFQIIFYNNRPSYFELPGQSFWMLPADEATKKRAERFVRSTQAIGGTEHMDALKMALQLKPDVVFFVTDARIPRLNRRNLDEVRSRATRSGTTIHAVELGVDVAVPTDTFLRTLAQENGGQYQYINVQTLDPVSAAE